MWWAGGGRGGAGHSCPFRQVRAICNQTYDLSGYQLGLHSLCTCWGPGRQGGQWREWPWAGVRASVCQESPPRA